MKFAAVIAFVLTMKIAALHVQASNATGSSATSTIAKRREEPSKGFAFNLLNLFDRSLSSSVRSSIKKVAYGPASPLLYGLSFAAALALFSGLSENKPLARLFTSSERSKKESLQNFEDQMTSGSNVAYQTASAGYSPQYVPADPVVQKFLTTKDGQAHYHHIFHYHVPYPMSGMGSNMGNLGTYSSKSGPNIPWYSPDSTNGLQGKPMILSSFYGNSPSNSYRRSSVSKYKSPTNKYSISEREDYVLKDDQIDGDRHDIYQGSEQNFKRKSSRPLKGSGKLSSESNQEAKARTTN